MKFCLVANFYIALYHCWSSINIHHLKMGAWYSHEGMHQEIFPLANISWSQSLGEGVDQEIRKTSVFEKILLQCNLTTYYRHLYAFPHFPLLVPGFDSPLQDQRLEGYMIMLRIRPPCIFASSFALGCILTMGSIGHFDSPLQLPGLDSPLLQFDSLFLMEFDQDRRHHRGGTQIECNMSGTVFWLFSFAFFPSVSHIYSTHSTCLVQGSSGNHLTKKSCNIFWRSYILLKICLKHVLRVIAVGIGAYAKQPRPDAHLMCAHQIQNMRRFLGFYNF